MQKYHAFFWKNKNEKINKNKKLTKVLPLQVATSPG